MSDPFEAFESGAATTTASETAALAFDDPAAEFLAREQAEMAKIENNNQFGDDGFGDFGTSRVRFIHKFLSFYSAESA